jgi:DNA-binding NarL/FixJ family response regulator
MTIRVHLADDHTMFREGLAAILASSGNNIEVVGQTSTGEEAIALIEENKPDVVITEVDMQLKEAKEILSQVRAASPNSGIIVLTMFDNLHYLQALSQLEINAYLHKSSSSEELLATLDILSRNPGGDNAVVSLPRRLLERLRDEPMGALSERETEIVLLAARGLSNRGIARELNLAPATVKRHLANVYNQDRGALQERGGEDRPDGAVDRPPRDHLRPLGWLGRLTESRSLHTLCRGSDPCSYSGPSESA